MTEGAPKKVNNVVVRWDGEHRFDGSRLGSQQSIRIDADATTGPGPVDTLLCALAACTGTDVVDILEKRRTPVQGLTIEVKGDRAAAVPARLERIHIIYKLRGVGIERVHAERAIELAVTKYCSVRDSLDAAMPVEWTLELA
ncbi:MAG: OsmC family protein [Gemmatimonadetes bacterium]|nr:OsmC family protein [Gemmatimonadota bacterium]